MFSMFLRLIRHGVYTAPRRSKNVNLNRSALIAVAFAVSATACTEKAHKEEGAPQERAQPTAAATTPPAAAPAATQAPAAAAAPMAAPPADKVEEEGKAP